MPRRPIRSLARLAGGAYPVFARWYFSASFRRSIVVRTTVTAEGRSTTIAVQHRFPYGSRVARYLVTTDYQVVTRAEFGGHVEALKFAAAPHHPGAHYNSRGRVLFLVDLRSHTQEVLAALALHVPFAGKAPLLVTCVALRSDRAMLGPSIHAALLLKAYAHEISWRLGREGLLDAEPVPDELWIYERLGFMRVSGAAAEARLRVQQKPYPRG
jgi:hypothetical protein